MSFKNVPNLYGIFSCQVILGLLRSNYESCFHQYFSVEKDQLVQKYFFSSWKDQNTYYVILVKKIGENKIRSLIWWARYRQNTALIEQTLGAVLKLFRLSRGGRG